MENKSKKDNAPKKEFKKIEDYFTLGNKKRNRDDVEKPKDETILKPNNKEDNQQNRVSIPTIGENSDSKRKKYS